MKATAEPVEKTSPADGCAESASVAPHDDHRCVLVDRLMPILRPAKCQAHPNTPARTRDGVPHPAR